MPYKSHAYQTGTKVQKQIPTQRRYKEVVGVGGGIIESEKSSRTVDNNDYSREIVESVLPELSQPRQTVNREHSNSVEITRDRLPKNDRYLDQKS